MSALAIWGAAALVYLGFRGWYDNWRGPIRPEEIDHYLAIGDQTSMDEVNDMALIRRFLEEDDGKEFVMLNLVKLHPKPVPHPKTGELTRAPQLLRGYIGDFMPTLLRHGGLPLLQARKVGPYVDAWGTEADPDWTIVGYMRYRSRRDMIQLATDPRFLNGHGLKIAAIATTFSFPTQYGSGAFMGPRMTVALVLALGAALLQIAIT